MIKFKDILQESNKILVPRRLEDRQAKRLQADLRRIEEYVKQESEGDLILEDSPITKLPDTLIKVRGELWLHSSKIQDLNNLREVEEDLNLYNTPISKLPDNLIIWGDLILTDTKFSTIPNNLQVQGNVLLGVTPLAKEYTRDQIKQMIRDRGGVVRKIYIA